MAVKGRGARQKGANGERELFGLLNGFLGREEFKRNLLQTRIGGADNEGSALGAPVALEVKRCEKYNFPSWIAQARAQAKPGQRAALAYRRSKEPWTVAVFMTAEQFATYYATLQNGYAQAIVSATLPGAALTHEEYCQCQRCQA
jgi:hypothetical protein